MIGKLQLLDERERSVGDLQPEVGLGSSHLSQQLGVPRRAGVKRGTSVVCSIASPAVAELRTAARTVLIGMLEDQAGLLQDLTASSGALTRSAG